MRTLPRPAMIGRATFCVATVERAEHDLNGTPYVTLHACGATPSGRYSVNGSPSHPSARAFCADHAAVRIERDGWAPCN